MKLTAGKSLIATAIATAALVVSVSGSDVSTTTTNKDNISSNKGPSASFSLLSSLIPKEITNNLRALNEKKEQKNDSKEDKNCTSSSVNCNVVQTGNHEDKGDDHKSNHKNRTLLVEYDNRRLDHNTTNSTNSTSNDESSSHDGDKNEDSSDDEDDGDEDGDDGDESEDHNITETNKTMTNIKARNFHRRLMKPRRVLA